MSLVYPILSILGETAGKVLDKFNFNKNKIGYKPLTVIAFLVMLALTVIFLIATKQSYPSLAFYGYILILVMIILSVLQNVTDVIGLSKEDLSLREPISNFEHLMAALIAFFVFPSERDVVTLLFVIIGVGVLLWANTKKHHLNLFSCKGTRYFVYSTVFAAILTNVYKAGLIILSPSWIFFFRVLGVFIITAAFLRFDIKTLTRSQWTFSICAGIAYFVGSLAFLFSIQYLGLLTTILLLMLAPALKYLGSYFILKEELTRKEIIGSFLLILVILFSLIY